MLLFVLVWCGSSRAQISPGPLSRAHARLDGVTDCRQCHGGGDEGLEVKCVACHQEIDWLRAEGRGLHAREGNGECARCHPEHAGRDFDLVDWGKQGRDGFDHARAGWALEGAHARVKCERCHRAELRQRNLLLRRPAGSGDDTWLGLESGRCATCHSSPHSARIGTECQSCHTSASWKGVQNFDHARTSFALTGRHARIECEACHRNGKFGRTEGREAHFAPIASDQCSACHKDPHAGRFGPSCSGCHVTSDFRTVPADRFEHARTRFPLRGAHARVKCDRCHDQSQGGWGQRPRFERCGNCHADPHAGTATLAGQIVDCVACHDETAFAPSRFDVSMHGRSVFALEGKHAQIGCRKCHRVDESESGRARLGPAGVDLRPAFASCGDCHLDAHAGQLGDRYDQDGCATCHDVNGWVPATIGLVWHASTGFELAGAHATLECRRCHALDRPGLRALDPALDPGPAKVALALPERTCADCHADVHEGRYREGAHRTDCTDCHEQDAFVPSKVDFDQHERFAFRLEGAHRATPCFLCHQGLDSTSHLPPGTHALLTEPAPPTVALWKTPSACQACHQTEVPR